MVLGGFTMHRIAGDGMNPTVDTAAKISAVSSALFPGASVLDTCCGLGYTAIGAAEKVGGNGRVVSIELDEASLEVSAPHSEPELSTTHSTLSTTPISPSPILKMAGEDPLQRMGWQHCCHQLEG